MNTVRFPERLKIVGNGVVLRDWSDDDLDTMVELFDEPVIHRWTPLVSPFDADAARDYLSAARLSRRRDRGIQLAVTVEDDGPALGEVLLFRTGRPAEAELAYSVGAPHRGRNLTQRSIMVLADHARHHWGIDRPLLRIDPTNTASCAVARKAGYAQTDEPVVERARSSGRTVRLRTWRPVS
ncbi:MAG TPA: GNAT family N-acetyltransferase [Candidatus Stackebrandtia excrementipullorum]|nr:GNAT family N-acetyltransferase [Candidatus Stackebrandtia excrementipullorum]